MIHARNQGKTFGMAIGEFSICNKPVISQPIGDPAHTAGSLLIPRILPRAAHFQRAPRGNVGFERRKWSDSALPCSMRPFFQALVESGVGTRPQFLHYPPGLLPPSRRAPQPLRRRKIPFTSPSHCTGTRHFVTKSPTTLENIEHFQHPVDEHDFFWESLAETNSPSDFASCP